MIVVRDIFRLKYGKAKEVKTLMEESKKFMDAETAKTARVLFDLVGPSYTLVLETSFSNLGEFEKRISETFANKEWGAWYQKFIPNVEQSYREIFTVFM